MGTNRERGELPANTRATAARMGRARSPGWGAVANRALIGLRDNTVRPETAPRYLRPPSTDSPRRAPRVPIPENLLLPLPLLVLSPDSPTLPDIPLLPPHNIIRPAVQGIPPRAAEGNTPTWPPWSISEAGRSPHSPERRGGIPWSPIQAIPHLVQISAL
jgi:hypothetical protein